MAKKGIDVSEFQHIYDFNEVKENGIQFAMCRAGFGYCTIDKEFFHNIEGFESNGIPYGCYWFSYACNEEDAKREAEYFCDLISRYCKKIKLPIYFDFEYASIDYARDHRNVTITSSLLKRIADTFIDTCGNWGFQCGIYCNPDFIYRFYGYEWITKNNIPLWLADWSPSEPSYKCEIWQYSETGTVSGIAGNVDLDEGYFNLPDEKPEKTIEECLEEILDEYDEICFGIMEGKYSAGAERKEQLGKYYDVAQEIINQAYKRKEGLF